MFKSTYGTMYYVDNMKSAVEFYKQKLGVEPTHESPDWTEFSLDGHSICLHAKRPGEKYRENGILIMNFDGTKSLYEKMGREGVKVHGLHEVHPGHWSFHVTDNSGNELSVFGPG